MSYIGEITKLSKLRPISAERSNKGDPCFIEQIRRKSTQISQCLEILEFGARQKPCNYPVIEQKQETDKVKLSIDNSIDSIQVLSLDEKQPNKETSEKFLNVFSNAVSSKLGIRRKSSYVIESPRKTHSSTIRKSSSGGYNVNRKNLMESISTLATAPCGVAFHRKTCIIDNETEIN